MVTILKGITGINALGLFKQGRDALFIALMAAAVLASWSTAADAADEFIRRYKVIAAEARSVWKKAQLQQSTVSEKRLRLEIELSNLGERISNLMTEVDTFRAGHLQAQLDSNTQIKSKSYERLTVLANCGHLLATWLRLVATYFETGRPIYLQAATPTYNTWEMLEEFRSG
jgi:hypothetical protein